MTTAPKHISKFKLRQPQNQWNKNPDTFIKAFNDPNIKKSIDDCKEFLEAGLIKSSGKNTRHFHQYSRLIPVQEAKQPTNLRQDKKKYETQKEMV